MGYTWEDAQLGIDYRAETKRKQEEMEAISDKQVKEAEWMAGASLVGSTLCGMLFGPAGSFLCKQVAKYGVDAAFDWESETIDPGKFNRDAMEEYNRTLQDAAEAQDDSQLIGTMVDLGTAYIQAGGLSGSDSFDWTTYGAGGEEGGEWSFFGRGTPASGGDIIPGADPTLGPTMTPVISASPDYLPGIWNKDKGLVSNLSAIGGAASTQYAGQATNSTLMDFYNMLQEEN